MINKSVKFFIIAEPVELVVPKHLVDISFLPIELWIRKFSIVPLNFSELLYRLDTLSQ
jgi:hypothetical protein